MNAKTVILSCAAVLILSVGTVNADEIAFGGTQAGEFGTIDLNTGVFTLLATPGVTLAGLVATNGTLYGADFNQSASNLYSVNPANGSLTAIGSSSVNYDDFGATTGGGLFAVGMDDNLYSIDPSTGAASLVGATGLTLSGQRSLSNNGSTLFFSDDANLYTLNTSTGAATLVGDMGGAEFDALILDGGVLYGASAPDAPLQVDTINTTTGVATAGPDITGTTSIFFGLAPSPIPSSVPEPGSVGLLGMAIAVLAALRRHDIWFPRLPTRRPRRYSIRCPFDGSSVSPPKAM
jgi:hypothetical protein